ncbi:MAG: hypothetical protein LBH40_00955 [Alphaproteobacteria bacterium]|jgi:hypothetical protein|nr:hypothetical protein [Alphaproteobacteria bacterium]
MNSSIKESNYAFENNIQSIDFGIRYNLFNSSADYGYKNIFGESYETIFR